MKIPGRFSPLLLFERISIINTHSSKITTPSTLPLSFGTSGVRALVTDLTPEACFIFARAFCTALALRPGTRLVIGHDLRPSSPAITQACIAAGEDAGLTIVYVGALATPAIAFYAAQLGAPAIVVTGSHIPFDRNGMKFYSPEGEITKQHEQAISACQVSVPARLVMRPLPAVCERAGQAYVSRYLDFFTPGCLSGCRIAVYQHSSVARDMLPQLFEQLGATVIELGRSSEFVPIDTEAVRQQDIDQAAQWARQYSFDMVVSTDGDADRPLIGDEEGRWLRGDVVGTLVATYLAADTVVTPVSSNTVAEGCGEFDKVVRTRIGSPYVIAAMQTAGRQSTVVGYEANGGFLLGTELVKQNRRLTALLTRDAVLPMLAIAALAVERQLPVSALPSLLPPRYTHSDRLQAFAQQRSAELLAALARGAVDGKALLAPQGGDLVAEDTTDGYRATFANGDIVHLRASGNAPELRCYAESESSARAISLVESCLARVSSLQ